MYMRHIYSYIAKIRVVAGPAFPDQFKPTLYMTIIYASTYTFLKGVVLNTAGICEVGRMVCWLGLFMPAASLANILKEKRKQYMGTS